MKFGSKTGIQVLNKYLLSRLNYKCLSPETVIYVESYEDGLIFWEPRHLKKYIDECQERFFYIYVSLNTDEGGHANVVIYDKLTYELERFEPHGGQDFFLNLDLWIEYIFWTNYIPISNYFKPSDFCPRIGLQSRQEEFNDELFGYCQPWSTFYTINRILNPELSRKEIVDLFKDYTPAELDTLIRKFSQIFLNLNEITEDDWIFHPEDYRSFRTKN